MAWYRRSEWTNSAPGCSTPFDRIDGVVIHYPGGNLPDTVGKGDKRATAKYLDAVRTSQMASQSYDYCDIEYSLCVDRAGNVWTLRGLKVRSGANGTADANAHYPSIFVLVGVTNYRQPTRAQRDAIRMIVHRVRVNGGGPQIRPHGDFVPTACPGVPLRTLISSGALDPDVSALRKSVRTLTARIEALLARLDRRQRRLDDILGG